MSLPVLNFKGFWYSVPNTPSLEDGVGTLGDCYHIWNLDGRVVYDIFDRNLGAGNQSWLNGWYIYYDGSTWNMTEAAGGGGAMTNPMTNVGDIIYGGVSGTPLALPGNSAAVKKYLTSAGTGSSATPPTWNQIAAADLSNGVSGTGTIILSSAMLAAVASGLGIIEDIDYQNPNSSIANGTYSLRLRASYKFTINQISLLSSLGTAQITVAINGTPVGSLSGLVVNNISVSVTSATDPNSVVIGDRVTLIVSGATTLANLQATLKITRT